MKRIRVANPPHYLFGMVRIRTDGRSDSGQRGGILVILVRDLPTDKHKYRRCYYFSFIIQTFPSTKSGNSRDIILQLNGDYYM